MGGALSSHVCTNWLTTPVGRCGQYWLSHWPRAESTTRHVRCWDATSTANRARVSKYDELFDATVPVDSGCAAKRAVDPLAAPDAIHGPRGAGARVGHDPQWGPRRSRSPGRGDGPDADAAAGLSGVRHVARSVVVDYVNLTAVGRPLAPR